jgi:hypothetical protein
MCGSLTQLTVEASVEIHIVFLAFQKSWYEKFEAFARVSVALRRSIEGAHCFYTMIDGSNS